MNTLWISVASLSPAGTTIVVDSQDYWNAMMAEFNLDCTIKTPLKAHIKILSQEEGVLFQGKLEGSVILPCNRCTEESVYTINERFDTYEDYPEDPFLHASEKNTDALLLPLVDEAVIRHNPLGHGVEINPSALAWQEFSLALPVKPLCAENCQGLCIACGANLNTVPCTCNATAVDPRMAPLQGITITKK